MNERKLLPDIPALEQRLGITMKDVTLLETALIHRSFLNENAGTGLPSNERLEFLGDAVLGFVVARWLYRHYPERAEGQLTQMRSSLVRNETLADIARRLGLGDSICLGRGEERAGGRQRDLNLACVYEAVVGAVAEDGGLAAAERFVLKSMAAELAALERLPMIDPKSQLQHLAQAYWHEPPRYEVIASAGPEHAPQFTVEVSIADERVATGAGSSKQEAEQNAAARTLEALAERGIDDEALRVGAGG
ncbi:MAG: ribonuclease III [Dehalococcoidia bacterium]|nr:ribonuclease III [Dehalococcoidia bacterium]